MGKKHLIIGGMGYLGSELLVRLREFSPADEITVVDLNWFGSPVPSFVTLIKKNAWELTETELTGFESVVMLSGLANDKVVAEEPRRNFQDNLALPTYVAWIARQAGVKRFIFSSTTSLYESESNEIWTETMPPRPLSPPSLVKWQVERALEAWSSSLFRVFIFRLGTIGGWSARPRLDLVINTMCKTAVANSRVRVNGPDVWRSTVSVRNTADVIAEACAGARLSPGIYNLVDAPYTLGQIADTVVAEARDIGLNVGLEIGNEGPRRNFRADGAKIHAALPGFAWDSPAVIARGVLEKIRVIPPAQLEEPRFYNYLSYQESRKP